MCSPWGWLGADLGPAFRRVSRSGLHSTLSPMSAYMLRCAGSVDCARGGSTIGTGLWSCQPIVGSADALPSLASIALSLATAVGGRSVVYRLDTDPNPHGFDMTTYPGLVFESSVCGRKCGRSLSGSLYIIRDDEGSDQDAPAIPGRRTVCMTRSELNWVGSCFVPTLGAVQVQPLGLEPCQGSSFIGP